MTDPLAGLSDIELPVAGLPETFAAMAFGLLIVLLLSTLLRFVAWRPPSAKDKLLAELFQSRTLDQATRLQRQAEILKQVSPGVMPELSEAIYRRDPPLAPDDVERRLIEIIHSSPHPEVRAKRASKDAGRWHRGASSRAPLILRNRRTRPAARATQGEGRTVL